MDFHPIVLGMPHSFMEYSEWQPSDQLLYVDIYDASRKTWKLYVCRMGIDYHSGISLMSLLNKYRERGIASAIANRLARPERVIKWNSHKGVRCGPTRPSLASLERVIGLTREELLNPEMLGVKACGEVYAILTAMLYDAHVSFSRNGITYVDRFPIAHTRYTSAMRPIEIVSVHSYDNPKMEMVEKEVQRTAPLKV